MEGDVRFVNAVEGGAEACESMKMSLGETVRGAVEAAEVLLIAVNAELTTLKSSQSKSRGAVLSSGPRLVSKSAPRPSKAATLTSGDIVSNGSSCEDSGEDVPAMVFTPVTLCWC